MLLVEGAVSCVIGKYANRPRLVFFRLLALEIASRGTRASGAEHETGDYRDNINLQEQ